MAAQFTCGTHTAEVWVRGGQTFVGDLTPLTYCRWERVRDDISTAQVNLPPTECCELLGDLRSVYHELHVFRDGEPVWEGPITRIEYEHDEVRVYAEDILFVAKRKVLAVGYDNSYPNIGYVMNRIDWLLRDQCYALDGDPWKAVPHLHLLSPFNTGPRTSRAVAAYEMYVWQDFDKYAEDHGSDYTVVNRDIYYWDHGLNFKPLPDLDEAHLSQFPRLVEYGNELYTRGFVSNAKGYAGVAVAPSPWPETYTYIDSLTTNLDEDGDLSDKLREAQDAVAAAEKKLADAQAQLALYVAGEATIAANATYLRAIADLTQAQVDLSAANVDNLQWLASEWQRWADELQKQASDTSPDQAAQQEARDRQKAYETARQDAEQKRELATRQQDVAEAARHVANITGNPADIAYANAQEAAAAAADAVADTAEANAATAKAASDAAWATARATNDPAKQAEADAIQAEANLAAIRARDAKNTLLNDQEVAKQREKAARDMEQLLAQVRGQVSAWQSNVIEAQADLDLAMYGRHGVPGMEDKDGLVDVVNEIAAATVVWADTARRNLVGHYPAPLGIVVPAGTSLLPGSGWAIQDLVPGAQFHMTITRLCRTVADQLIINAVRVEESAPNGEKVQLTATSAGVSEPEEPV